MFAKLTALVGGGSALAYNVEEAYPISWGCWKHHKGTSKEDGSKVSIFKVTGQPSDLAVGAARHGVKRLRTLRHPNVVTFKDTVEIEEKGSVTVYLVTEPVQPLKLVLDELTLSEEHRNEYLAMGLNHIASVVSFLNNDCKMIHGNVCMASVVVTETLDWKLHGFDMLSDLSSVEYAPIRDYAFLIGDQYKSAEIAKGEWAAIPQQPPWGVDAWGLGCLMQEVFSGQIMMSVDELRDIDHIPEALLKDYQRLLGSQATRRLNPSKVAKSKFLNNQLVDVVTFMENLAVKESVEKESFFRKLPSILPALPTPVAQRKILPMLASSLEYGGAPAVALMCILQIGKDLDEDEFTERVIPSISRLFASNDRAIRRGLLENIDKFGNHMDQKLVEEQVYPHLQTGFADNNAYIRELTLKSMRSLAPKMSQKTLNQSLLKFLAKLQVDQEPTIRANTTVLLGSIAEYLGEAACKRVLLNAFGRAVRDQFPHARIAGLKALMATKDVHSPEEVAQRVIPMTAPIAVDPVEETRLAAIACLETFTDILKKNSEEMKATAEQSPTDPTSQVSKQKPVEGSGYLSWAVSSLGLKSKAGAEEHNASPSGISHAAPATHFSSQDPAPSPPSPPVERSPKHQADDPPVQSNVHDGWGDGDEEDEFEDFEEDAAEIEARKRLARNTVASRKPVTLSEKPQVRSQQASKSQPKESDGWGDELDDMWEDMGMKAESPKPVAKPSRPSRGARVGGSGPARKPMKLGAQKLTKKDF
ncbi:hypothetical protein BSKO_01235 [Bryopsis sp. KO-2023]|nr:hypothetical protein BSKO_01235 [Bryopsis sp. KO-2023]